MFDLSSTHDYCPEPILETENQGPLCLYIYDRPHQYMCSQSTNHLPRMRKALGIRTQEGTIRLSSISANAAHLGKGTAYGKQQLQPSHKPKERPLA